MGKKDERIFFASPLRYPGGKTGLATSIRDIIKSNFNENQQLTLAEPYAGGAGASLALLCVGAVDKIIINDLDRAIFAFWDIAVSDTDYLIDKVSKTDITVEEWRKQKEIFSDLSSTNHRLAFATLFLNRTNRSGILNGGPIGGLDQSGTWSIDARFVKSMIVNRLNQIKALKHKIKVFNLDGIDFLKKLEEDADENDYLVFLDPPYYKKGKSLYLNHYKDSEHKKLSECLMKTSLKWIMTYDDTSYICNLYEQMRQEKFEIQHSAYKSKKGKEVLILADSVAFMDIV